jgi:hypothetical protein
MDQQLQVCLQEDLEHRLGVGDLLFALFDQALLEWLCPWGLLLAF